MLLQRSALAILSNHMCHERVRATSHLHRPAIDTALDRFFSADQPAKPQSWRERFRETANAEYLLTIRKRIEARRHSTIKRKIAIDIILYNQQAILSGYPDNLDTSYFRQ